jgi:hypothetical protein
LGVPAQKRQRRQADPLQSFASTSAPLSDLQKDFRLHPSRGLNSIENINYELEVKLA